MGQKHGVLAGHQWCHKCVSFLVEYLSATAGKQPEGAEEASDSTTGP